MGCWDRAGPSAVKISVADVRVEHEVKFADFIKWLDSFATRRERPLLESFNPRNASFTLGADFPGSELRPFALQSKRTDFWSDQPGEIRIFHSDCILMGARVKHNLLSASQRFLGADRKLI